MLNSQNSFIVSGTTSQELSFGSIQSTRVPKLIAGSCGSSRNFKRLGEKTPTKTLIECLAELDVPHEDIKDYFTKQVA